MRKMYIPCDYKKVDPKVMERIKAEEKLEQPQPERMKFCRRVESEDSEEVSDTSSVYS